MPFLETTHDELLEMTALQFVGPFHLYQALVRKMARSAGGRGGSIVQISSATATIMFHDHAAYMGTKAGTDHVIRCVANEFGAEGHPGQLDLARRHRNADDRRCAAGAGADAGLRRRLSAGALWHLGTMWRTPPCSCARTSAS